MNISKQMLTTLFYLGVSTVFFVALAIIVIGNAEGILGLDFFMLICLMQVYIITLHLKIHMLTDTIEGTTQLVDEILKLAKEYADRKAATITTEQMETMSKMSADLVFDKMDAKVSKTAADLRAAILGDDEEASDVAKKAIKAIRHMQQKMGVKVDDPLPDLAKWKLRDK